MANKLQTLQTPQVPNLPQPPSTYRQQTEDERNNLIRSFMLKLVTSLQALFGPNGGQYVEQPYGVFFNTADQTLVATNTAKAIEFTSTYVGNGVKVNAGTDSRIYVSLGGIYNFQFSGQLVSGSSSAKQVYIWIVRNGTDIGYSTHQYTLSGSSNHLNVNWNFSIDMQAGDYLEMEWAANDTGVTLEATAAASPHPGIPSAVMTVSYVSPLPQDLPTPP
jgi:hypothetical protein